MKKIFKILFITICFIPFIVKAYGIDNYLINATVEENGDLTVEEYFTMTGEYNGFERIINYKNPDAHPYNPNVSSFGGSTIHNASNIELITICAVDKNNDFSFENVTCNPFKKVSYASSGDYGVYTVEDTSVGKEVRIYLPDSYGKAFYIKYTLTDMAVLHKDVAELGWNIVGDELSEDVAYLEATVNLPNNSDEIRAWAHGPLNGNVSIASKDKVVVTISGLSSYRAIDVRTTFSKSVIKKSTKKTGVTALPKILKYEESKAEQANYEREQQELANQNEAERLLAIFSNDPYRYNYQNALDAINKVTDENKKANFLTRLNNIKEEMDRLEEQEARECIDYKLKYISYGEDIIYNEYSECKDKVEILDNLDVKNELSVNLETIKQAVIKTEKNKDKNAFIALVIMIIIEIIFTVMYYLKVDKEHKTSFNQKYFRDIPDNFSPTTVSYLLHKKITDEALSASILELYRKKFIRIEETNGKKDDNYILYNEVKDTEKLTRVEKSLINLIFGKEKSIDLKTMKKNASTNYNSFVSRWNKFVDTSMSEAKKEKLYLYQEDDDKDKKKVKFIRTFLIVILFVFMVFPNALTLLLLLIAILSNLGLKLEKRGKIAIISAVVFGISAIVSFGYWIVIKVNNVLIENSCYFTFANIIACIILLVYVFNANKKTLHGNEEYKKWKALKRFLKDFGRMDEKELPEVNLWEKFLVFAIVLGCADKLSKTMKMRIDTKEYENSIFYNTYDVYRINRVISRNVRNSVVAARSMSAAASSSSSSGSFSSGSGGGGGFSSGGGSFGGGGGGGRF